MGQVAAPLAIFSSVASGFVQYRAAQDTARAQERAAEAAEAQGRYNAQIAANNAIAQADQARFKQGLAEANKYRAMQAAQTKRGILRDKLEADLAKRRVSMPSLGGSFQDVFKAEEAEAFNKLATFDFDAAESSYQYNLQAGEAGRQANLAWSSGMADRDLTLITAANQAYQFRTQAAQTRSAAFANALATGAETATFAASYYKE